jgi:signal transduction histidine kinase
MSSSIDSLNREALLALVSELTSKLSALEAQNTDLEILLENVVEHSTELEKQVYQQNEALQVAERHVRLLNKALEERVRQRTAELQAANRQLAQESAERKQAQEEALKLAQLLLEQRAQTIERTYEAVHNGPLQELAVLLRADLSQISVNQVRSQLHKINHDLRGIYQAMRMAVGSRQEELYLEGGLTLDLSLPLPELLLQTFDHTLERDFPGFATIQVQITPDLTALATAALAVEHKRGLCLFLQEALCNVGKHALGTTRLSVVCEQTADHYRLCIIDNGQGLTWDTPLITDQQGTRQAQALAQQLGGTFRRQPHPPQGTRCELVWPKSLAG